MASPNRDLWVVTGNVVVIIDINIASKIPITQEEFRKDILKKYGGDKPDRKVIVDISVTKVNKCSGCERNDPNQEAHSCLGTPSSSPQF